MSDLVITYGTSDGKKFDDRVRAENHQFDLDFKEDIWWTPNNLRCEAPLDNHQCNAKPLSTRELARLLLAHPDMPAKTHEGMGIDRVRTRSRDGKVSAFVGEDLPM